VTAYRGVAPLTLVRTLGENGTATLVYVDAGRPVPASADPEDVKRLVAEGFLEAVKPEPAATGDAGKGGAPAKSASKADWKAYAIAQGVSEEDAEKATRDELAALYLQAD
jgi:hypothetical protein